MDKDNLLEVIFKWNSKPKDQVQQVLQNWPAWGQKAIQPSKRTELESLKISKAFNQRPWLYLQLQFSCQIHLSWVNSELLNLTLVSSHPSLPTTSSSPNNLTLQGSLSIMQRLWQAVKLDHSKAPTAEIQIFSIRFWTILSSDPLRLSSETDSHPRKVKPRLCPQWPRDEALWAAILSLKVSKELGLSHSQELAEGRARPIMMCRNDC